MQLQPILVQFQEHPQSWIRVDTILEKSTNPQSKILALGILFNCVKFRWLSLPAEQRAGMQAFVVNLILKLSADPGLSAVDKQILHKLNLVLVQVVKQEWPHRWPSFIPDLVNSSKTGESLCANNLSILLLLSEEIFDFSAEQMTQQQVKEMKHNLTNEFAMIFQLCEYVLQNSQDRNLLTTTLKTLLRFLHWIPEGYIFETSLIESLVLRFFPIQIFQNLCLECLCEIATIKAVPYDAQFTLLFKAVIEQCCRIMPSNTNLCEVYESGNDSAQTFIRHLAIFITGFLNAHLELVENGDQQTQMALYQALLLLLRISEVDERVVFRICLDYWSSLVTILTTFLNSNQSQAIPRLQKFGEIFSRLRRVFVERMPKPEEVLIVEDGNGGLERETLKDSDGVTLYNSMRDSLVQLTHLDSKETLTIMITKLDERVASAANGQSNNNSVYRLIVCCYATRPARLEGPQHDLLGGRVD
jgi:exportin-1